jgi:hypothetical protein
MPASLVPSRVLGTEVVRDEGVVVALAKPFTSRGACRL